MNNSKDEGSTEEGLYVNFAQTKLQRKMNFKENVTSNNKRTNMYIKSLKKDLTEEEFREIMQRYGEITSICLKDWKSDYTTPKTDLGP